MSPCLKLIVPACFGDRLLWVLCANVSAEPAHTATHFHRTHRALLRGHGSVHSPQGKCLIKLKNPIQSLIIIYITVSESASTACLKFGHLHSDVFSPVRFCLLLRVRPSPVRPPRRGLPIQGEGARVLPCAHCQVRYCSVQSTANQ